ncbi:MAG: hypothetical protein U9N56_05475 [Actinomycetota bacterium]|nr:hypothetical protein [Actinomycetota bacterium]
MATPSIEAALEAAERAVADEFSLSGTGFWPAVGAVRRSPELADRYAERMAAIDQAAFDNWVLFKVPLHVGTTLMVLGTLVGLALIAVAYSLDAPLDVLSFFAGLGVLLVTTHGLGHLVVGTAFGIGFTGWFIGTLAMPQPGVKVDYSSYLRAPASKRAWMHASGALTTKAIPFLLVGAAAYSNLPGWTIGVLIGLGVVMVITDVLWSTKSSDWKKFRREMSIRRLQAS